MQRWSFWTIRGILALVFVLQVPCAASLLRSQLHKPSEEKEDHHGDPHMPPWHVDERLQSPLMDSINALRAHLCIKRPDLSSHRRCLRFLTRHCRKERTGHGHCTAFKEYLAAKCLDGSEKMCAYEKQIRGDTPVYPETDTEEGKKEDEEIPVPPVYDNATTMDDDYKGASNVSANPNASIGKPTNISKGPHPVAGSLSIPDKSERGLPDQGYNEHSSATVEHNDMESVTSDWHEEFPPANISRRSVCSEQPNTTWCKLYLDYMRRRNAKGL